MSLITILLSLTPSLSWHGWARFRLEKCSLLSSGFISSRLGHWALHLVTSLMCHLPDCPRWMGNRWIYSIIHLFPITLLCVCIVCLFSSMPACVPVVHPGLFSCPRSMLQITLFIAVYVWFPKNVVKPPVGRSAFVLHSAVFLVLSLTVFSFCSEW